MGADDRIRCPGCGRAVIPQLWVDNRNRMRHPTFMHLCPFCGAILKESGGRTDRRMIAFVVGFSCLGIIIVLALLLKLV